MGAAGTNEHTPTSRDGLDLEGRRALGTVLERLLGHGSAPIRVGRYEVGPRLGTGGCATVYAGRDPQLSRDVAIKVLLPSPANGDDRGEVRLVREAQALAKLRHPNIVEIFDVGVDELGRDRRGRRRRGVYLVMERIAGPNLRQWLGTRPPRSAILDAFAEAAEGLAAAHAVGVIHRDFKPANAMLTPSGRVKVLDFGLAREELDILGESTATGPVAALSVTAVSGESLTRTGAVMGTPRYMAPEQHRAQPATAASDQYSLCVGLWEALCGTAPFAGDSLQELGVKKQAGVPRRPHALSRAIYRVLVRGLHPDPAKRYADVAQLASAIRRVRSQRRAPRRTPLLAVGGIAAFAGVAALTAALAPAPIPAPCDDTNPSARWRDSFAAAVAGTGADPIEAQLGAAPRVQTRLDRFANGWDDAFASVCIGDPERLQEREYTERVACLQRGRDRFVAIVDGLLAQPGALEPRRRLLSLSSPRACIDAPEAAFRRTEDDDDELDAIEHRVLQVVRLRATMDDATATAVQADLDRAKALGDTFVTTEALVASSMLARSRGDTQTSAHLLLEAIWVAEAQDDHLLAAELAPPATGAMIDAGASPSEVQRMVAHAESLFAMAGAPTHVAIALDASRSFVAGHLGRMQEARAYAESAIARAGDPPRPGSAFWVTLAHHKLAWFHYEDGALAAAERALQRIFALDPRLPMAPSMIAGAHGLSAMIAIDRGDDDTAIAHTLEQIRIFSEFSAPTAPSLVDAIAVYAQLLIERGHAVEGMAHLHRLRQLLLDDPHGNAHFLPMVEHHLLCAEMEHGDPQRALRIANDVLDRDHEHFGEDSPHLAWAWLDVAYARESAGDRRGAAAALDSALARMDPSDDHVRTDAMYLRGKLHLQRGEHAAARDDFVTALGGMSFAIHAKHMHGFRGEAYLGLADALRGLGDDAQADAVLRLADEALSHGTYWHRIKRPAAPS